MCRVQPPSNAKDGCVTCRQTSGFIAPVRRRHYVGFRIEESGLEPQNRGEDLVSLSTTAQGQRRKPNARKRRDSVKEDNWRGCVFGELVGRQET
jgi:hypothetical protein